MAIKYYSSIDLRTNQLQNALLHNSGSDPSSPTPADGQIYFNTGDNTVRVRYGGAWNVLSTGTGDITSVVAGTLLDGGATSGAATLNVDLTEAAEAAIANGDYILFLDAGATGTHAKEAIHDVATLFSGTGLTATNSVMAVDAAQTQITSVGALNAGSITSGFGNIDNGSSTLDTGAITGTTIDASTDFTIGTTVITDDSIVMTPTTNDTATIAATTNGALAITTVDTAAAAANITITADGTFEAIGTTVTLDSGGAINLEPASGSAILLDGTISVDAGVDTGATSITSTAFVGALTGNASGTAATVTTAAQTNITSLGTLTALDVDDINLNGKVLTITGDTDDTFNITTGAAGATTLTTVDTAAAAGHFEIAADGDIILDSAGQIKLEPVAGNNILLDGTIAVDAGVVTGATSITSTAFVGTLSTAAQGNITSLGTLTALTVDDIQINGATIGHGDDTDLMTLADGILTVAGEVSMTTLDLGGQNVTASAGEINVLDAVSAGTVTASLAVVVDGNKDIGTFRNITLSGELDAGSLDVSGDADIDGTLEADAITINSTAIGSIYGAIAGSSSIVTTGALDSGSITSGFGTIDTGSSAITTTGAISGGTGSTFSSSSASEPIVHITNTHAGATAGELRFNKDSASGDDNDVMGTISWYGTDDDDNTHERLA